MKKNSNILLSFILFFGVYFPTSLSGNILDSLMYIKILVFYAISLLLIFRQKTINPIILNSSIAIFFILFLSTMISDTNTYAFGTLMYFVSIYLMMFIDFKKISITSKLSKSFILFNIITLAIGYLTVIGNETIGNFLVANYSNHKSFLVLSMVQAFKPVITFGSHTIASLMLFFLFYLNYNIFETKRRKSNLFFSLLYLGLIYFLQSNSSYLFLVISLVYILFKFFRTLQFKKRTIIVNSLFVPILFFISWDKPILFLLQTIKDFQIILSSPVNGVLGRFGESGVLKSNIEYIASNPFKPLGFGYNPNLTYTDSGLIELITRGTIILPIIIYSTFYFFLKKNLVSKNTAYFLFFTFVIFDMFVYPIIRVSTTFYVLSFTIVLLNHLEINKTPIEDD